MSREQVLEEVDRAVRQARGYCDDVEFSAEDATRSDWDYLVQVFGVALEAGATHAQRPRHGRLHDARRVRGADPLPARARAGRRRSVIFAVHCHDDLGLAVANTLAAIQAGARQVECTVNGIGERAGNTAMEEVVMALKTRPDVFGGLDTGIRTTEIYPTSRLLSSIIGVPVQPNKAIVGDNAFAHEAGIHQDGVLKAAITYEIMTPQSIGRPSQRAGARQALRAATPSASGCASSASSSSDAEFEGAFQRFKDLADKKKTIYNEDIEAIVADVRAADRRALRARAT